MKCLIKYFNSLYTNETNLYGSCRRGLYTMNWERLHHYELIRYGMRYGRRSVSHSIRLMMKQEPVG